MTFRDDHEATLARADALERELAEAREDAAAKAARLDDAEREQQRLARELSEARDKPVGKPVATRPAQREAAESEERDWWWIRPRHPSFAFYVIVILIVGAIAGRFAWTECG